MSAEHDVNNQPNSRRIYRWRQSDQLATSTHQDLGSLGVPFLSVDEDGRSVLNKPLLRETKEDDKPAGVDQPPKPNEDFPDCTTYFYHRWMWIQVTCGRPWSPCCTRISIRHKECAGNSDVSVVHARMKCKRCLLLMFVPRKQLKTETDDPADRRLSRSVCVFCGCVMPKSVFWSFLTSLRF